MDDSPRYFLNLGIYGVPRGVRDADPSFDTLRSVRTLLARVRDLGGFQHSYCDVFQTRDEFYEMFDESLAKAVRARLGSERWPTVYEKVRPEIAWETWLDEA